MSSELQLVQGVKHLGRHESGAAHEEHGDYEEARLAEDKIFDQFEPEALVFERQ